MNDMKSRAQMLSVLGASAINKTTLSRSREERPVPAQPKIEPTPTMMLTHMEKCIKNFEDKVNEWNNNASHKLLWWKAYGWKIAGTTQANAMKRARKFQAECYFQPGITLKELDTERSRLQALIKKTTLAVTEEE